MNLELRRVVKENVKTGRKHIVFCVCTLCKPSILGIAIFGTINYPPFSTIFFEYSSSEGTRIFEIGIIEMNEKTQ